MKKDKLFIVVPCYNEEEVIEETTKRLQEKLESLIKNNIISKDSKVLYVNDGSKDNTWRLIEKISKKHKLFTGISLSRNRGHQNALVAGLMIAKEHADIIISMDADLQDDINAIDEMIEKYYDGCEIVYGVRSARKTDTFFKKFTAEGFYKFMSKMGVDIIYNHADYRLTSKKVLNDFGNYREVNLFLRGIFPLIGYKSDIVYYERNERFAGESKYPLKKMLNFAWDGITSFSVKPIRLITSFGIIVTIITFIFLVTFMVLHFVSDKAFTLAIITAFISFLFGLQTLFIGIIGEYIGKTYSETKQRPRFIIDKNLLNENNEGVKNEKRK